MKRACKNCNRELSIVRDGMCFVCAKASKGLSGAERDSALAEVKKKIAAGKVRHRASGNHSPEGSPGRPERQSVQVNVPAESPREIPVTIRLMIEIGVRISGVAKESAA